MDKHCGRAGSSHIGFIYRWPARCQDACSCFEADLRRDCTVGYKKSGFVCHVGRGVGPLEFLEFSFQASNGRGPLLCLLRRVCSNGVGFLALSTL